MIVVYGMSTPPEDRSDIRKLLETEDMDISEIESTFTRLFASAKKAKTHGPFAKAAKGNFKSSDDLAKWHAQNIAERMAMGKAATPDQLQDVADLIRDRRATEDALATADATALSPEAQHLPVNQQASLRLLKTIFSQPGHTVRRGE